MSQIIASPLFGITLSIVAFSIATWIHKQAKTPLANPLLIAIILIIAFLLFFDIPLETYESGSAFVTLFIVPYAAVLAVSVYRQRATLFAYFAPILVGTLVGAVTSLVTIIGMSALLNLDLSVIASILGQSITTPVAISIAEELGGLGALTITSTLISGLLGNLFTPTLTTIVGIKDPVAIGVGFGSTSHGLGTAKALELGEVQGAMSGISMSFAAIWTVLLAPLFFRLVQ